MYTEVQMSNFNKNLSGTNWSNARIENGKILADYYGSILYPIGDRRYQPYEGQTTWQIKDIQPSVLNSIHCYGKDQKAFMKGTFDYAPIQGVTI